MTSIDNTYSSFSLKESISIFKEITKIRLSISVLFSSLAGYFLAIESFDLKIFIYLIIGGYGMVGASNVFNQIIEKDLDALMKRTENRPLPTNRISIKSSFIIGVLLTIVGLVFLYLINAKTAMFAAISIFMYVSLYTPLKTKTSLSVFVGAFPGAIPYMLGWVAATGEFGIEAGVLFAIQFFWQFPHFWSIGWCLDDDYKKGGFKMLPSGKKDKSTALQIISYTFWTILLSIIPYFGVSGSLHLSLVGLIIVIIIGLIFLYFSIELYKKRTNKAAKTLMLISVSYLTLLQIIYILDKFLFQ